MRTVQAFFFTSAVSILLVGFTVEHCLAGRTEYLCGDGVVDAEEQCENGQANIDLQPNSCRAAIMPDVCDKFFGPPARGRDRIILAVYPHGCRV